MGRIMTPLLNLIMTLITMVTNSSLLSQVIILHKSISFYVYFNLTVTLITAQCGSITICIAKF
jgi:hypothetical protein